MTFIFGNVILIRVRTVFKVSKNVLFCSPFNNSTPDAIADRNSDQFVGHNELLWASIIFDPVSS